jgi:hypothetical protein
VIPILVDERRLAAGLDGALAALTFRAACEMITPAALLERLTGVRVVGDAERRAVLRRIAATRDDIGLPRHVCASTSFAQRAAAAIDETGERAPFEVLVEHYRTLLAFANVLDVPDALHRALSGERRPIALDALRIDAVLMAGDDDRGFAWRRLCAAAGITLEAIDLGPVEPPVVDRALVAGVDAILRYAESESDAAARSALVCRISGVAADDGRALLTATAGRALLLETIDAGRVALSATARNDAAAFARGLRAVTRAYGAPDAGASSVLAAIGAAFTLDDDRTVAALVRSGRSGTPPRYVPSLQRSSPARRRRPRAPLPDDPRQGSIRSRAVRSPCDACTLALRRSMRMHNVRANGIFAMYARRSKIAVRRHRSTEQRFTPHSRNFICVTPASMPPMLYSLPPNSMRAWLRRSSAIADNSTRQLNSSCSAGAPGAPQSAI